MSADEANSEDSDKCDKVEKNTITLMERWEFSDTDALHGLRGLATLHVLFSNYVGFVSSVDLFVGIYIYSTLTC